jgi:allantoinase
METFDLLIRSPRVLAGGAEIPAAIGVRDGVVIAIQPYDVPASASVERRLEADVVLMPGLVDTHVHACEPGNTDWEGFATATRAAAAGGVTTLIDMPLDSVPSTVTVAALDTKRRAADGQCLVDVGLWGGVVPGNLNDLAPLHEAGVLGFKCFLADSGTDDFPPLSVEEMTAALGLLRELDAPLLVHAESAAVAARIPAYHGRRYLDYLGSRPREIENVAVAAVIAAARSTGGRAHILHLSSADALPPIAAARREGVRLSAETCPHYLTFGAEEIADGATAFACSPPIREAANRELLWDGLRDGVLDLVASDHSPSTVAMKELDRGDFGSAWGGISSLQLSLPATWTAARECGFSLVDVARWMAERPATLAGLVGKGRIAVGFDADFAVFAPDERFVVDPATLFHRHPITPYAGRTLHGVVRETFLRGVPIDPQQPQGRPRGRLLRRDPTKAEGRTQP